MIWMVTISLNRVGLLPVYKFFNSLKAKWQYGIETGTGGYKHIQARFEWGYDDSQATFLQLQQLLASWFGFIPHIEPAKTKTWEYERKDGLYFTSEDTVERRKCRFSPLREWQRDLLKTVNSQGVREIDVFIDRIGGHGKTHLVQYLWENGNACLIPRHKQGTDTICQSIHNKFRKGQIIIFDIERNRSISKDDVTTIEIVKDGILEDTRYKSREINIRGVKIVVFTNNYIYTDVYKSLSKDRWRVWRIDDDENGSTTITRLNEPDEYTKKKPGKKRAS